MVGFFDFLFQHVISEPFVPSPFLPAVSKAFDSDFEVMPSQLQKGQTDADVPSGFLASEKDINTRENNVAKIKVVVRCSCCKTLSPTSLCVYAWICVWVSLCNWWGTEYIFGLLVC